ncbi:hypothetical protein CEUSTIGMA_g6053.t1 [Chlamydomonas eustigma]|uniref:SET domain-containing protein n=1 Tax=Chlamydomonas eustigma TaxID=1157962 RepID=A0A250X6A4_9CHLO|nr:hypothetical protein CEUSTIGMA_g6053.t1 [Chlamydomonas eustigma]|eukprot:GAX78614.1 hypothetical protein CEUSTIGMA_g6053.t1 [Chlamydomonas eustigma]
MRKRWRTCSRNAGMISIYIAVKHAFILSLILFISIVHSSTNQDINALIKWVEGSGGMVHARVGENAQGVRGLLATRYIPSGDPVVSLPSSLAIQLGNAEESAPELGIIILRERYRRRPRFSPYFTTLPPVGDQICVETLPTDVIPMLRGRPKLVDLITTKQAWAKAVFNGQAEGLRIPLSRAVPSGNKVSELEFSWATCMASSRALCSPSRIMYLIPVIDMANHDEASPHVVRWEHSILTSESAAAAAGGGGAPHSTSLAGESSWFQLVAGTDLHEGDEVTISYGPIRADEAALYYGYVPQLPQASSQFTEEAGNEHMRRVTDVATSDDIAARGDDGVDQMTDFASATQLLPPALLRDEGMQMMHIQQELRHYAAGAYYVDSSSSSMKLLCAVDHGEYDTASRPGKNLWPQFTGTVSDLRAERDRLLGILNQQLLKDDSGLQSDAKTAADALEECNHVPNTVGRSVCELISQMLSLCNKNLEREAHRLNALVTKRKLQGLLATADGGEL